MDILITIGTETRTCPVDDTIAEALDAYLKTYLLPKIDTPDGPLEPRQYKAGIIDFVKSEVDIVIGYKVTAALKAMPTKPKALADLDEEQAALDERRKAILNPGGSEPVAEVRQVLSPK